MFERGDIVKVKCNIGDRCASEYLKDYIGEFDYKDSNDIFSIKFTKSIKCYNKNCKCDRDKYYLREGSFIKATEREEFLYRMYGSGCLKNAGGKNEV